MTESRKSKKDAKQVGIELWTYLAQHPEISNKYYIEDNALRERARQYYCQCPLCEFYKDRFGALVCEGCPLAAIYGPCDGQAPTAAEHPYILWAFPDEKGKIPSTEWGIRSKRRKNALKILEVMKAWEVE